MDRSSSTMRIGRIAAEWVSERVVEGVQRLQSHGIRPSVIAVLTHNPSIMWTRSGTSSERWD